MKRSVLCPECLIVLIFLLIVPACVSQKTYDETAAERDSYKAARDSIAAEEAELRRAYEDLSKLYEDEIAASELTIEQLVNGVQMEIPSDVLFQSGGVRPTFSDESREQLQRLAEYLNSTDFHIAIVGHTDSQKPVGALAERYPTNWELGAARAANAVRALVDRGVDPERIVAVSKGEFKPIDTNETADGRANNRRVEIVLRTVPTLGE